MNSETQSASTSAPKVDMFLHNYLLKKRGLSHSSLHRSNSDFYRTPTEDCEVVLDRNLAESRRPPNIEDEITLILYDAMLESIVDTWEGKTSVKFLKKPDPTLNFCDVSVASTSQTTSQDSIVKNVSKASSSSSKRSGSKKRDSKTTNKKGVGRPSKTRKQSSSEVMKSEKELKSQSLEGTNSPSYFSPMASHISTLEVLPEWKPLFPDEDCTISFKNGALYIGRVSRKSLEGKGLYRWSDGTIYEGDFVENVPHGFGTYTWPDMSFYEGHVYEGLRHGSGFFVGPPDDAHEGHIYFSGNWHMGKLDGKGIMKQGYQTYEGSLENSVRTGFGVRHYDEYNVYAGEFVDGIRNGKGTMVWDNNDVYIGNWENGLREGYGEYIWEAYLYPDLCFFNQTMYYGNWRENIRHGLGSLILRTGSLYDGNWDKGLKHGIGLVVCRNGLIVKSERLYYKNHPAPVKEDTKNVAEETTAKIVLKKNPANKSQKSKASPKSASIATTPDIQIPEIIEIPPVDERTAKKALSKRTGLPKESKIERAMVKAIEKKLNYNRTLFSANNLKPRSIPLHLPDHYIVLEYHLNRLMKNVPNRVLFQETKPIRLAYNSSISFHTAPFDTSTSNIFNLDIDECKEKSPEISSKFTNPTKTLNSICTTDVCTMNESSVREREECHLRNMITLHILLLRKAYGTYASIGLKSEFPMKCKPVIVRLFLWQLYRDCGIQKKGMNLIQLDRDISINVSSCMLYDHHPFERIQFFQFLHCLLEVSWNLYGKHMNIHETPKGVLATSFDKFVLEDLTTGIKNRVGHVLTSFRNDVPMQTMYEMYKQFGEPLTVRDFVQTVQNQCNRSEESFANMRRAFSTSKQAMAGHQGVLQEMVIFCPGSAESVFEETPEDILKGAPEEFDLIGLQILKDLSIKDLLICCGEICPGIFFDDYIVNIDYEITFLEFYEILIMCFDRIFYNIDYEKWKTLEDNRLAELEKLTKTTEKKVKEKKKKTK